MEICEGNVMMMLIRLITLLIIILMTNMWARIDVVLIWRLGIHVCKMIDQVTYDTLSMTFQNHLYSGGILLLPYKSPPHNSRSRSTETESLLSLL